MLVKLSKSEVVLVGNVGIFSELMDTLGCKIRRLPMNELGMPLGLSFKVKTVWNLILEKMEQRL